MPKSICPYFWKTLLIILFSPVTMPVTWLISKESGHDLEKSVQMYGSKIYVARGALTERVSMGIAMCFFGSMILYASYSFGSLLLRPFFEASGVLILIPTLLGALSLAIGGISIVVAGLWIKTKNEDRFQRSLKEDREEGLVSSFVKAKINGICPLNEYDHPDDPDELSRIEMNRREFEYWKEKYSRRYDETHDEIMRDDEAPEKSEDDNSDKKDDA